MIGKAALQLTSSTFQQQLLLSRELNNGFPLCPAKIVWEKAEGEKAGGGNLATSASALFTRDSDVRSSTTVAVCTRFAKKMPGPGPRPAQRPDPPPCFHLSRIWAREKAKRRTSRRIEIFAGHDLASHKRGKMILPSQAFPAASPLPPRS